ncbi:carboxymuconolactone decarboxylase family protein [Methanosarcina barkeri]|uniref:Carboxymuconolactone decarboxylase-like domain-containing protein n=1 Tax=Methanosarcina barkeri (strain Fusaro / DSM 804) TaxID=269797 RepID=Q465Q8_METBF|nr:carboxymuconolactone decarboxylase family protein [Methanosarcina barkeri]
MKNSYFSLRRKPNSYKVKNDYPCSGDKNCESRSYKIFQKECPEVAASFNDHIETQKALKGLDAKTGAVDQHSIQTANRNLRGVQMHAMRAKNEGATHEEIVAAVVLNLHHSGFANVLECLPAAIDGFEGKI